MNIQYCTCGTKVEYNTVPPKSCPKCKVSFASLFKTPKRVKKVIEESQEEEVKAEYKWETSSAGEKTFAELEAEEFSEDDFDRDSSKDLSQEIKASLNDMEDIIVTGFDTTEKLGTFLAPIFDKEKDKK